MDKTKGEIERLRGEIAALDAEIDALTTEVEQLERGELDEKVPALYEALGIREEPVVDEAALRVFRAHRKNMLEVLKGAARRDDGFFDHAVTPEEAPDYRDVVHHPVDLSLIKRRVNAGRYAPPHCNSPNQAATLFVRDLFLVIANAMMYNAPGSDVTELAQQIKRSALKHLAEFGLWPIRQFADVKDEEDFKPAPEKRRKK